MGKTSTSAISGYLSFPRQKLSDREKNDEWFQKNVDFAEHILNSDVNLRSSFKNKKINYDLRSNKINPKDFAKFINPDKLDLDSLPASFQHIGIENSKINLLLGEYANRKQEFKIYLSANDIDGVTRKENQLLEEIQNRLTEIIQDKSVSEAEIQKRLQALENYKVYEYQDIAEITANKILKREWKEKDFDFTFLRTFEDLLTSGEQIVFCGVLGGEPVLRRVNPMNLYTLGGNSMYIEDSDIIVEYGYQSIGQVIDDYWDVLKESDIEFLETGSTSNSTAGGNIGLNKNISIDQFYGEENAIKIFSPNEMGIKTFAGAFDTKGNVRVLRVCWRSRRKIGELTYFDEDGQEQKDWVPEDYKPNKAAGETVKWKWVNEWLEGTKIADTIYANMRPLPFSSKSLVNKSKGIPSYIGTVNSTNDYAVQSLMDIMKPLAYSYDIAYYKRELEIATYKGSFAAINSAMIPSGWDPAEWMRYVTINKFAWLDPTNEILKGPSQGKSAGAFNTLTATNVQLGDPNVIQMYTNILINIEDTLGKVSGVTGAREGQIGNREAVGNVEREVAQTSHITEKWFALDSNFRKRVLTKYLECCKYAYKKNPKKGQFILDDMGQEMINSFDEFSASEFDIHVSNSTSDNLLKQELKALSQAAIQNGQATIADLVSISRTDSVQGIARKLEESARKIREENNKAQQEQLKSQQEQTQMMLKDKQEERAFKITENEKDRQLKREELNVKLQMADLKEVSTYAREEAGRHYEDKNHNGIDDVLDARKVDIDENHKKEQIRLAEEKLAEDRRSHLAKEIIAKHKSSTDK